MEPGVCLPTRTTFISLLLLWYMWKPTDCKVRVSVQWTGLVANPVDTTVTSLFLGLSNTKHNFQQTMWYLAPFTHSTVPLVTWKMFFVWQSSLAIQSNNTVHNLIQWSDMIWSIWYYFIDVTIDGDIFDVKSVYFLDQIHKLWSIHKVINPITAKYV